MFQFRNCTMKWSRLRRFKHENSQPNKVTIKFNRKNTEDPVKPNKYPNKQKARSIMCHIFRRWFLANQVKIYQELCIWINRNSWIPCQFSANNSFFLLRLQKIAVSGNNNIHSIHNIFKFAKPNRTEPNSLFVWESSEK